jgi:hypothetical protein
MTNIAAMAKISTNENIKTRTSKVLAIMVCLEKVKRDHFSEDMVLGEDLVIIAAV